MKLTQFIRDQRGGVLITTGLGILFLIGIAGAAIDLGQQQLVRARIQQSSDAAALAAATFTVSNIDQQKVANRYFNINYAGSYIGVSQPAAEINVGTTVTVTASSSRLTTFMGTLGNNETISAGRTKVVSNPTYKPRKYDMVLVMDNTLSMGAQDVGVGAPQSRIDGLTYAAKRIASNLLNDAYASGSRVGGVQWYTDVQNDQVLLPTTSLAAVNNFLDHHPLRCCTDSSTGLEVAYNSIRPQFTNDTVHAVVLLTDGLNNHHGGSPDFGGEESNKASEKICHDFKKDGTLVFAIGYGKAASNTESEVSKFLARCATNNPNGGSNLGLYYFIAPDTGVLDKVFGTILETIKKVRIEE